MSVLQRLKKQGESAEGKKLFAIIAGPRLSGKSTLAGTLKGKTLMLQAAVLESGSESAKALAKQGGGSLDVISFTSLIELRAVLDELRTDAEYDNVYIDGLSAVTEMKSRDPAFAATMKRDNWAAFRELGEEVTDFILKMKELSYGEKAKKPKNVFLTCALKIKQDKNGAIVDVELDVKGNVAVTAVTKFGEAVVTVLALQGENGLERRLITKPTECWPGRVDGKLDSENPGSFPADLTHILNLVSKK